MSENENHSPRPMLLPRMGVKRPVFTSMVTLIVVILGAVSLSRLRIDLLPAVEMPTLTVSTGYEGASPEVMERLVTQFVEEIVATVPNVEEISSESSEGDSDVRVTFAWGTDIDTAALDVLAKLEDEINELPDDIVRPRVRKFDIASFPVVLLGVSSRMDLVELTTFVEEQIRYRFARVPGVAQVDLWGGYDREIRIEIHPERIVSLDLPLDTVLAAVRNSNLDLPAGRIARGQYEVTLRAPAEFTDLDQIRDTVVAVRSGAPVTIGQIADVVDTHEKLTRIVRINGEPGIRVAIRKQADANTVEVSRAVLEEIDAVNAAYPHISVVPVINQGNFIERSIRNVTNSVLYGGALAIFVLLIFLRTFRSTLVISLSIPISIVATFALVYLGGFTLNLMTLGGLALGVGMMVDNSIVVLENIFRRRDEEGEDRPTAAVRGASEVGPAIVASTITTMVILLPLVFVRGVTGLLFKEFAYVIVFSLGCSLLVSLSLVPMLAARLVASPAELRARRGRRPSLVRRVLGASGAVLGRLDDAYRSLLAAALRARLLTVLLAAALLGGSLFLYPRIGSEFLPPSDEGEVRVSGEMDTGTRLAIVDEQTRKMEAIVLPAVPEILSSVVSVREGEGEIRISLVPALERTRSNTEIADDLRERLSGRIPGMEVRTRAPQGQFLLERLIGGQEGITVEVRGFDLATLSLLAARVEEEIRSIPGITDIDVSRDDGMPQTELEIDRAKAADLSLQPRDVAEVLETAVAGSRAGEFRVRGTSHPILVQLKDAEDLELDQVLDLTLSTPVGEPVSLRNVVASETGRGPVTIERKNQQRLVTVQANVAGRDLGSVARDVTDALATIPRPTGYDLFVAGKFEEQEKAFLELIVSMVLALLLVYMVMACQYESLLDPLIVMISVPVAAVGVLLTLFLTETTFNVQSWIGCIMLGGIVVNNAILLVDQAGQLRRNEGFSTRDAVAEAGRRRLRPILMTTLTTMLGLLPLAFGIGEGADAQAPLARAVVGGLLASTLITLVLIPVVYSLLHRDASAPAESDARA